MAQAAYLSSANYVDIDFDTISQSLNFNAFWDFPPESAFWDEQIDTNGGSVKVEVGVLTNEKPTQPEDLSLGGALMVLGEDSNPSNGTQRSPCDAPSTDNSQIPLSSPFPLAITSHPPNPTPITPLPSSNQQVSIPHSASPFRPLFLPPLQPAPSTPTSPFLPISSQTNTSSQHPTSLPPKISTPSAPWPAKPISKPQIGLSTNGARPCCSNSLLLILNHNPTNQVSTPISPGTQTSPSTSATFPPSLPANTPYPSPFPPSSGPAPQTKAPK